jgi:hypothetical protein
MRSSTARLDMSSLLVFEPFRGFPPGLKIRVHDEARLDSLGRSLATVEADGALVLDVDSAMANGSEHETVPAGPTLSTA